MVNCYTIADVAKMLRLSRPLASALVREIGFRVGSGRTWRVSETTLTAWIAAAEAATDAGREEK